MTSLVTDVEVLCVQLYLWLLLSDICTSMDLLMTKLSSFLSLPPGPLVSLSVLFLSITLSHFVSPVAIYFTIFISYALQENCIFVHAYHSEPSTFFYPEDRDSKCLWSGIFFYQVHGITSQKTVFFKIKLFKNCYALSNDFEYII
jgi:hypothetical protein